MAIEPEASSSIGGIAQERVAPVPVLQPGVLTWVSRVATSTALARAAREILIVTIGILIAFALNAWWEAHKEARQEQAHLRALASDFEQNVSRLRELVEREDRIASGSLELLRIAGGTQQPDADALNKMMGQVFSSTRFEPVMGAYEALVNSTGLTLIHDDKLRAALASFAAQVTAPYMERFADELYFSFVQRFTGRLGIVGNVLPSPVARDSYAALLADVEFQEYLGLRNLMEKQVAARYRDLQRQSEKILSQLQRDID
jgi:hypothetical protein